MCKIKLILLFFVITAALPACNKSGCKGTYAVTCKTLVANGTSAKPLEDVEISMYTGSPGYDFSSLKDATSDSAGIAKMDYNCKDATNTDLQFYFTTHYSDLYCWNAKDLVPTGHNITKEFYFGRYTNFCVDFRTKKNLTAIKPYYVRVQAHPDKIIEINDSSIKQVYKFRINLGGNGKIGIRIIKSSSKDSLIYKERYTDIITLRGEPFIDTIHVEL